MAELRAAEQESARSTLTQPTEIYEGQTVTLTGFVWREAFPGLPDFRSIKTGDEPEVYWMLVLASPITLIASSPQDGTSFKIPGVKKLQMMLDKRQYEENCDLVLSNAQVLGRLWPPISGHCHGDAQIEVKELERA